jgi:hypothetical protein
LEVNGSTIDGYNDGTACALTLGNRLTCWGLIGYSSTTGSVLTSTGADMGVDLARVLIVGGYYVFGFDASGRYVEIRRLCSGSSAATCSSTSTVDTTGRFDWLATGSDSENVSCAIRSDGQVICGGPVPPSDTFRDIDAASWETTVLIKAMGAASYGCGVTEAGFVECFGRDVSMAGVLDGP